MKLNVYKNSQNILTIDLSQEVDPSEELETSFFIGRSKDCHVVLDDRLISREHSIISFSKGNWNIKQLSEFNPLIVNGNIVSETKLRNSDIIKIGNYEITVEIASLDPAPVQDIENNPLPSEEKVQEETIYQEETVDQVEVDQVEDDQVEDDQQNQSQTSDQEFDYSDEPESSNDIIIDETSSPDNETELQNESFTEDTVNSLPNDDDDSFMNTVDQEEPNSEDDFESPADDFAMESYDDDADDSKTQVFKSFTKMKLELFGEGIPFNTFSIENDETAIGRDPKKCQIVLDDLEVSGVHAKIILEKSRYKLKDLDSGNGTLLNGVRISESFLANNDEFIIGNTTFTVFITSSLLDSEKGRLMPVESNQVVEVEEIIEINPALEGATEDATGTSPEASNKKVSILSKEYITNPKNRKKIIYAVVGLLVLLMLLGEDEEPTQNKKKKKSVTKVAKTSQNPLKTKFSKEQLEFFESQYLLGKELYDHGKYSDAILALEAIFVHTQEYKKSREIFRLAKMGVSSLEKLKKEQDAQRELELRNERIKKLLVKAHKAVKDRRVELAETYFQQILELDPDSDEVLPLKNELKAWKKEKERVALQKAQKEAERQRMVSSLAPSKLLYQRKKWKDAIVSLEKFLDPKNGRMDEDLTKKATIMLEESRKSLREIIDPLLIEAESLAEGQDFKGAYQTYSKVLEFDSNHTKAITEKSTIRESLILRARKVYREALISESLSLFSDAKEKFQEVQQIAPTDSDYYERSTKKLKDYLD